MRKVEFRKTVSRDEWNQQGNGHILILLCLPETPLTRPESPGAPSYSLPHRQVCGLAGNYND